jgi:SAM-dependent methyltransferase
MSDGQKRVVDLGCGGAKTPGAFGIDARDGEGVDLVHDLNRHPWPVADNSFDRIVASHIVEHVDDVLGFFREIHRLAADGARVEIATPHFSNRSAYMDPTHRHYFSARFIEFIARGPSWTPSGGFATARSWLFQHHHDVSPLLPDGAFQLVSRRLYFSRIFRKLGIEALANRKLDFYEFHLAFLFPARDIHMVLQVNK